MYHLLVRAQLINDASYFIMVKIVDDIYTISTIN